jgi:hypothetical protein
MTTIEVGYGDTPGFICQSSDGAFNPVKVFAVPVPGAAELVVCLYYKETREIQTFCLPPDNPTQTKFVGPPNPTIWGGVLSRSCEASSADWVQFFDNFSPTETDVLGECAMRPGSGSQTVIIVDGGKG